MFKQIAKSENAQFFSQHFSANGTDSLQVLNGLIQYGRRVADSNFYKDIQAEVE